MTNSSNTKAENSDNNQEDETVSDDQLPAIDLELPNLDLLSLDRKISKEELRASAEQGDAEAQCNLGVMYYKSLDYVEALKWYRLAADQGYADAQNNLGVMYSNGLGVPQDNAEAYAWFYVAATGGHDSSEIICDFLAEKILTPEELSQAQQRATELFEKIQSSKK